MKECPDLSKLYRRAEGSLEVVGALEKAWKNGRGIVPLLGAGISVESGIPALAKLIRYLAKVRFWLDHEVYLSFPPDVPMDLPNDSDSKHDRRLHIRMEGWPEPYQLDADLWLWFDAKHHGPDQAPPERMDLAVQEALRNELKCSEGQFIDLVDSLAKTARKLELHRFKELMKRADVDPMTRSKLRILHSAGHDNLANWCLAGNWRTFLGSLTDGDSDQVDALFQKLVRQRRPGTSHRYLAFLTRLLGLRLILTTNFDSLIEQAMRAEGLDPVVYDIALDARLPDPTLMTNHLSVVKLHGGAYGLRVGERLDAPLDEESRRRLRSYLPENPLLVAGLGAGDRRIMDLIEEFLKGGRRKDRPAPPYDVVWLHFDPEPPKQLTDLLERLDRPDEGGPRARPAS